MNLSSLLLLTTLHGVISSSEYGFWPLITPLLNVSAPCLAASLEYKSTLETISPGDITGGLTPTQRDALRMSIPNILHEEVPVGEDAVAAAWLMNSSTDVEKRS